MSDSARQKGLLRGISHWGHSRTIYKFRGDLGTGQCQHVADFGVAVDLPADRQRYEDVVYIKKKKNSAH